MCRKNVSCWTSPAANRGCFPRGCYPEVHRIVQICKLRTVYTDCINNLFSWHIFLNCGSSGSLQCCLWSLALHHLLPAFSFSRPLQDGRHFLTFSDWQNVLLHVWLQFTKRLQFMNVDIFEPAIFVSHMNLVV